MILRNVTAILYVALPLMHFAYCVASQSNNEKSLSTSISSMVQLLETEMHLIHSVQKFADAVQEQVNALYDLVDELSEENQKALANREEYLSNPLNGFSLIRRMHYDWPKIELFMMQPEGEAYLSVIRSYRTSMPTAMDVEEASEAINRLQTVYDLKAEDIARGILNGKQYDAKWKSVDSFYMASYLFGKGFVYPAGFWLYTSIMSYEQDSIINNILGYGKEVPLKLYAETLVQQNRPGDAVGAIVHASDLKPMDARLLNRKNEIMLAAKLNTGPPIAYPFNTPWNYELGCRGNFSNKVSNQYCLYNTNTTPFLRLAPLKMEILHTEPYMVLFHNVLSDREIEHLKSLAIPNLQRATVYNEEEGLSLVANTRTSKFSWFADDTDEITERINRRIIDMTGFDISGSEMMQVMNYGLGGHYDKHYDFFNLTEDAPVVAQDGDRIATVLFYLSDVEQGGATVFPEIETAVFPRKGSAVFWHNLDNEVKGDPLTLHAACPVIVGSKWVCNKWIRSKAQIFRKPCYK